jgi:uncharacterized protein (UPF0335 family)
MSLLDRTVNSSIAENSTIRRLHDMSYSAINGERQQPQQLPQDFVMFSQLSRGKPIDPITKEMIEEYKLREDELNDAPNIINGVQMKYKPLGYDLTLKPSISTSVLVSDTQELIGDRVYVSGDIQRLEQEIKDTSDNIKKIKNDINLKGSNYGNLRVLNQEITKLERQEKQLKEKNKLYDYIENTLKANEVKKKDIDRLNAITAQDNKAKLSVYEQELNQSNRNRLNLQQHPNESEAEYYQRLKELQTQKYDPVLYEQRALNQNTLKLKQKLGTLFKDTSFKEDILKFLNNQDKYLLNKNFDKIGKSFLEEYGYDNKSFNSQMASKELSDKLKKILQGNALTTLQAAFKRTKQADIYRDAILLERDKETSLKRREEEDLIRDRFRREQEQGRQRDERIQGREILDRTLSQGQKQLEGLKTLQASIRRTLKPQIADYRTSSEILQSEIKRGQAQTPFGRQKEASKALQSAFRRQQQQDKYKDEILDERDRIDFESAREEELARKNIEKKASTIQRTYRGSLGRKEYKKLKEKKYIEEAYKKYLPSYSMSVERLPPRTEPLIPKFVLDQEQKNEESRRLFDRYSSMYPLSSNLTSERKPSSIDRIASTIQRTYRGRLGRKEYEKKQAEVARLRLREAFKPPRSIAGDTELSNLSTPAFSRRESNIGINEFGKIRKIRSDKGLSRGEYSYSPDKPVGRPRKPRNPVGRPKKTIEEGAKGDGIRRNIYKRKISMIGKDDKMKNRLRLVASQIDAGNTNPRLIGEVNNLYKKLYNIDNAYQYLNKNKK